MNAIRKFIDLFAPTYAFANPLDMTAGTLRGVIYNESMNEIQDKKNGFSLTSPAFLHNASIPPRFTCDRENINPPLQIWNVPANAQSLVLIMEDPDVPQEVRDDRMFDHWVLFNIPPQTREVNENDSVGTPGANTRGKSEYTGPCPPSQYQPTEHRYFFKLYALDTMLELQPGAPKAAVMNAMQGHIISETELMGRYQRHEN